MMQKLNKQRITAIVFKDVREVLHNRMAVLPMLIVPLIFCLVLPLFLIFFVEAAGTNALNSVGNPGMIENITGNYAIPSYIKSLPEQFLFFFLNYSFMALFMLIPLMASSIIAANSIVGEKERRTLETLLYTPITNAELLWAKLLSSFIPAMSIAFFFFGLYFGVMNLVSLFKEGYMIVQSWLWLPALFLLAPAVSLFGLSVTVLVSLKAKTFMEAQQFSAFIILPLIALVVVQVAGLLVLQTLSVVVISGIFFLASYLVLGRLAVRFNREKIIEHL